MARRTVATKQSSPRFGIFGEVIAELKKVVWLSRREAAYLTMIVLIVAIVVGLMLGAVDLGFTRGVEKLFPAG